MSPARDIALIKKRSGLKEDTAGISFLVQTINLFSKVNVCYEHKHWCSIRHFEVFAENLFII